MRAEKEMMSKLSKDDDKQGRACLGSVACVDVDEQVDRPVRGRRDTRNGEEGGEGEGGEQGRN